MSIVYPSCIMVCMAFLSAAGVDGSITAAGVVMAIGATDNAAGLVNHAGGWFGSYSECTVVLMNYCTAHSLVGPRQYLQSGRNTTPMPHTIGPQRKTTLQFNKTPWSLRGVVGVFAYDLRRDDSRDMVTRLAVMFSVPYFKENAVNWQAAGFFPLWRDCDYDLFEDMYYYDFGGYTRRPASEFIVHEDGEFTVKATMADNGTPVMRVEIYDNWQEDPSCCALPPAK